jgi:hypothetical protein
MGRRKRKEDGKDEGEREILRAGSVHGWSGSRRENGETTTRWNRQERDLTYVNQDRLMERNCSGWERAAVALTSTAQSKRMRGIRLDKRISSRLLEVMATW